MRPYQTIKLIESPDIADIQTQARSSHIGRFRTKSGDFKASIRSAPRKRAIRRYLKRSDKARAARFLNQFFK